MGTAFGHAIPAGRLNEILWRDSRGSHSIYQKAKHAAFALYMPTRPKRKTRNEFTARLP
jgi:hypothetical protein